MHHTSCFACFSNPTATSLAFQSQSICILKSGDSVTQKWRAPRGLSTMRSEFRPFSLMCCLIWPKHGTNDSKSRDSLATSRPKELRWATVRSGHNVVAFMMHSLEAVKNFYIICHGKSLQSGNKEKSWWTSVSTDESMQHKVLLQYWKKYLKPELQ